MIEGRRPRAEQCVGAGTFVRAVYGASLRYDSTRTVTCAAEAQSLRGGIGSWVWLSGS